VLIGARPLHPYRPLDRFRQQRRVRRRFLMPVAAVAAGAFDVDASTDTLERTFAAANCIAKSATYDLQSCALSLKAYAYQCITVSTWFWVSTR
jgi:hypothetical protein